jgi:hypothetical protein
VGKHVLRAAVGVPIDNDVDGMSSLSIARLAAEATNPIKRARDTHVIVYLTARR